MSEINEKYTKEALDDILKTLHRCQTMPPIDKMNQYIYELDKLKYLKSFPNISDELIKEIEKPIKVIEDYFNVKHNF